MNSSGGVSAPNEDIYRGVGARIRAARLLKGVTQDQLALAVGLNRTSVTNIEKGRQKLLLHKFLEIAMNLGVSPSILLEAPEPDHEVKIPELPDYLTESAKDWIVTGLTAART